MTKINIIFLILFSILINFKTNAQVNVKYKGGNQIISNVDILNEKNYLIFLRPELKKLPEKEIIIISEKSLIREIIKKKELDIVFENFNDLMFIDEIKKNLLKFKKVKTEDELKFLLKKNKIEYEKILEKMKYEALWSELIYKKYNSLVKIDKENLKKKLVIKISNDEKFEYNLSEILFEVDNKNSINQTYETVINYIKKNNFKTAATKYSISNTSNKGGEIGWVKETLLSENLINILKKMKINDVTKPIRYPSGYLILKINDKKKLKRELNMNEELKEAIRYESNRQLNQFSLMHYKKLKQNSKIDEY